MYDVIVIGVGAMGSSACMHLARRGARVLGLERSAIPHDTGSSHGHSRMIRLIYSEHPDYVPLLRRAYELWRDLEAASGRSILRITGGIYMGRPDGEFIAGARRAALAHGLDHETLDGPELARRFPQFRLPDDFAGFWEPTAGYLVPEAAITAHAEAALRAGAEIHAHEPVAHWAPDGAGFRVRTSRAEYRAGRLVFCGGAWAGKLVADLGVPLVATRQVLGWVWPRRPELFEPGRVPVWAIDAPHLSPPGLYYGFPMAPEAPGFKLARHAPGRPVDPDVVDRKEVAPDDEEEVRTVLRSCIPDADGPLLALRTCLYENSPDAHFIIDRHPAHEGVAVACGFSGHGFKFASVVGEILADLALDGRTRHPIGFLSAGRFGAAAGGAAGGAPG